MPRRFRLCLYTSWVVLAIILSGCTEEKAEAVKVSAERFRDEAITAIIQINDILKQAIEMPDRGQDKTLKDLQDIKGEFTTDELAFLLSERNIGARQKSSYDEQLQSLILQYSSFAAMFENLPQGRLFAAEAVERAQKHAVNLTLQLINFATLLNQNKIPVKANVKRVLLTEQIKQNLAAKDPELRAQLLKNSAKLIDDLGEEETKTREAAIKQCLKAAEAGKLVTSLIRDYKSLNVRDIMGLTKESLGFLAHITDQNADITSLLNRYQTLETTIRNDSYFKKFLDVKLQ